MRGWRALRGAVKWNSEDFTQRCKDAKGKVAKRANGRDGCRATWGRVLDREID